MNEPIKPKMIARVVIELWDTGDGKRVLDGKRPDNFHVRRDMLRKWEDHIVKATIESLKNPNIAKPVAIYTPGGQG